MQVLFPSPPPLFLIYLPIHLGEGRFRGGGFAALSLPPPPTASAEAIYQKRRRRRTGIERGSEREREILGLVNGREGREEGPFRSGALFLKRGSSSSFLQFPASAGPLRRTKEKAAAKVFLCTWPSPEKRGGRVVVGVVWLCELQYNNATTTTVCGGGHCEC